MGSELYILHFFGPRITSAQTSGRPEQKARSSDGLITKKAVDKASETAADGCAAQAARLRRAARPVLGSMMWLPLTSVPEPLKARPRRCMVPGASGQRKDVATPTGQPGLELWGSGPGPKPSAVLVPA